MFSLFLKTLKNGRIYAKVPCMAHKNKKDKGESPGPGTSPALRPVFGTYCATQSYALTPYKTGASCHIHLEAYLLDPATQLWGVSRVMRVTEPSIYTGRPLTEIRVQRLDYNLDFTAALKYLSDFENNCAQAPAQYVVQDPKAGAMKFLHYIAFAEREGYIFNTQGQPAPRPNIHALPPQGSFRQEDIARANKNLQRPADEFDGTGPAGKVPQTHFLFDQFRRATHNRNINTALAELRVMTLLDQFAAEIETVEKNLRIYGETYLALGQGGLILDAEQALERAVPVLRQIKAYGVDTAGYESFLTQCGIICDVMHAQGLYDLMQKGLGDFTQNEELFKLRVDKAVEGLKKIDPSDESRETLKKMIVQAGKPRVPAAIGYFVSTYKKQRADYDQKRNPPPPKPPAP